ncbi:hypothetical protein UCDDA912_g07214 [Diaporthe ampelina]|uniref:Uncharacterized protein n=1 Tax=Diaporthe ampelina TaxID=1214573 RepID=A0A0G2FFA2_9PEZI|nr:hypothetical protein UCDDA912_g07214 [Diaporthe ampelina]
MLAYKCLGFQKFALEFHLPFYAYKKGSELVKDRRFKKNKKPLRRTVTGVDHWSWTAFAFVDTYYMGAGNQESVEHYIDQVQLGLRFDPLTQGQYEAEPPTHDDLLSEPEHRQGLAHDVLNKDTQIFFDRTTRLLHQMSYQISLMVDAWMRFMNAELAYFTNLENLPGKKRTPVMLISEINKEVEDLLVLRKNLDHQRDLLHGLSQKLEKGLQLDNNAIAALQQKNAVLITALTISASVSSSTIRRDMIFL